MPFAVGSIVVICPTIFVAPLKATARVRHGQLRGRCVGAAWALWGRVFTDAELLGVVVIDHGAAVTIRRANGQLFRTPGRYVRLLTSQNE